MLIPQSPLPPFSAPYAPDDRAMAARLLRAVRLDAAQEARIDRTATRLIEAIRANDDPLGGVEDMLREFALSTKEGLALMVLAEALLRVPDAGTADQFIEDKLAQGDFIHHETRSSAFLVNASAWALGMSARVIQPGETPQGTIGRLTKRLGAPPVRAATRQAMRLMGNHFALGDSSLAGWDGFGLAIQAYQKRASDVIDYVDALARSLDRKMMVRLVKGAYWDTEIKRAQEHGLDGYPVFTRKAMTDLNYLACAKQLLALRPRIFPQFATHNALTVATILELATDQSGFEFQRLHGMGEALYAKLGEDRPDIAHRTYAPVGSHRDLLAYLVRRLLENGANSSFVALAADEAVPVSQLLRRPADVIGSADNAAHPKIPLPRDLYGPKRKNSRGIEFGERTALEQLVSAVAATPIQGAGSVADATESEANAAILAARDGFKRWTRTLAETRAAALEKAAEMLERRAAHFIALLQREGGKTLDDSISEVREAVDFCRYYAAQGRELFGEGKAMPGPTGESNMLKLRGRGAFVAISPWNFPLAIFTGQITAALMAGNTVIAKPAEQTPLIAFEAVRLLHEAGIPQTALHFVPGDGQIGAALVADRDIAGVVFTGLT